MHKCVHHGECVKARGQLIEVSVLSPLYEFYMLNSDLQTCQNAPYPLSTSQTLSETIYSVGYRDLAATEL